jgi:hypothetical protein
MKLLTKELIKQIPTLAETDELGIEESFAYAKFFNPMGNHQWFITAYDPEQNLAFGYVNLNDPQMAELGYISIQEIENIKLPFGMTIERDRGFSKMPLTEVMDAIQNGRHI